MKVLVIDVGGTNIKFLVWGKKEKRSFPSGKQTTPRQFVETVLAMTADWEYDVVSIGIPGQVVHGRAAADPPNLGKGWTRFDFQKHFKKPTKVINDAVMQALGSYHGGRMLFVGLGTGLGSALILDDVIVPLELGELSYAGDVTLGQALGKQGLAKSDLQSWEDAVNRVVERLAAAFRTDYVVVGGGNVKKLSRLPSCARRGSNDNAFIGGARLWTGAVGGPKAKAQKHTWVIT